MDEIKQRLSTATDACIKAYEAWRAKSSDHSARETLQEAVHELRKVAARLEIELAVSDRKAQGADPIPIPAHRAARRQGVSEAEGGDDDSRANRAPAGNQGGGPRRPMPQPVRRPVSEPAADTVSAAGSAEQPNVASDDEAAKKAKPLSLRRGGGGDADAV